MSGDNNYAFCLCLYNRGLCLKFAYIRGEDSRSTFLKNIIFLLKRSGYISLNFFKDKIFNDKS